MLGWFSVSKIGWTTHRLHYNIYQVVICLKGEKMPIPGYKKCPCAACNLTIRMLCVYIYEYIYIWSYLYIYILLARDVLQWTTARCSKKNVAYYKSNSQDGVRKNAPRRTEAGGRRLSFRKKPIAFTSTNSSPVWCISPTDSGNAIPWGYSISHIDMEVSPSFLPYSYKMEFLLGRINDPKNKFFGHWDYLTSLVAFKISSDPNPTWLFRHLPALLSRHVTCHDAHLMVFRTSTPKTSDPRNPRSAIVFVEPLPSTEGFKVCDPKLKFNPSVPRKLSKTVEFERNVGFWGFRSVGKNMKVS